MTNNFRDRLTSGFTVRDEPARDELTHSDLYFHRVGWFELRVDEVSIRGADTTVVRCSEMKLTGKRYFLDGERFVVKTAPGHMLQQIELGSIIHIRVERDEHRFLRMCMESVSNPIKEPKE